jgi:hypothetical protein
LRHEFRRPKRRCVIREMKDGPSRSAISDRSGLPFIVLENNPATASAGNRSGQFYDFV